MENLLLDWKQRIIKAQVGHYISSEKYQRQHLFLGIILITASAFVSSALFLQAAEKYIEYIITFMSITSTVTASLIIFIRPSEKSERHRSNASKYGVLRRKVEFFSSKNSSNSEVELFLSAVQKTWDDIAESSPLTPKSCRSKAFNVINREIKENIKLKSLN